MCKSDEKSHKTEIMQSDKCEGYVQHFGFRRLSASVELDIYAVIFVYVCQVTVLTANFCTFSQAVFLMDFA